MKIVIVGGGPAGFYCAERLIKNSEEKNLKISVSLFEKESLPLYSKIRLPDLIAGKVEKDALILKKALPEAIDFHYGEEILCVDYSKKTIRTGNEIYTYDKLILAMGAYPFIPPIPGCNIKNVFALRTMDNALKIRAKALESKSAIIIGGGVLGLELAVALDAIDVKVSVIEVMPRLLANILTEEESKKLAEKMKEAGILSYLNQSVNILEEEGESIKISFKDNQPELKTDMVIFNTGIRCQTHLTEGKTPETEKAFVVNKQFLTTEEDVYAIGDCAEFDGKVEGLWMAAKSQGEALADILTGEKTEYDFPTFKIRAKLPFKI